LQEQEFFEQVEVHPGLLEGGEAEKDAEFPTPQYTRANSAK